MENGKLYGADNDFGIIVNGKYFECEWMTEVIDFISKNVTEKQLPTVVLQTSEKKLYSVKEVAAIVKRHKSTITYHIGLGLLKAAKPGGGKSWIITEKDFQDYLQNVRSS